jgi:hypothetical protein
MNPKQVAALPPRKLPEPEPEPKPEPERPQQPASDDPLSSVLKNVLDMKKTSRPQPTNQPQERSRPTATAQLSLSEIDAIRRQIERCWNVPAGARDAKDLVVDIRVALAPDGEVISATPVDQARMARDPFYRVAAESAQRAVLTCSPLSMPQKSYEIWKDLLLTFDPSQMFGA